MNALRVRSIRPALLLAGCFLVAIAVAGCATKSRSSFTFDWNLFIAELRPDAPGVAGVIYITVVVSVIAQALGVMLGIFAALGKMARLLPINWIANCYIWIFRGTPLVVQLVLLYYGFAVAHIFDWSDQYVLGYTIKGALWAAIVILGVNEGAYMAEIVRAGIMAVDPGQTEAAKSLGMPYRMTMSRIVLPQAARVIIPPLGNEFNNMLKTTSLIFVLGVIETYNHYVVLQAQNLRPFEAYLACACWFLLMTTIWSLIQGRIERRFARGTATGSAPSNGPGLRARLLGGRTLEGRDALGGH
jgi:polar amino acid transport system permease protein